MTGERRRRKEKGETGGRPKGRQRKTGRMDGRRREVGAECGWVGGGGGDAGTETHSKP